MTTRQEQPVSQEQRETPEEAWVAFVRSMVDSNEFSAPPPENAVTIPWQRWVQLDFFVRGRLRELTAERSRREAAEKAREYPAIHLKREEGYAVVCVETTAGWVEVIREFCDSPFSHIVEPSGIKRAIDAARSDKGDK